MNDNRDDSAPPLVRAWGAMLERTGAKQFQMRYSDDEQPVVWIAVGTSPRGSECAAALSPERATERLLEQVVDGAHCQWCGRPTGIVLRRQEMPVADLFCWYADDPELDTFRRGWADGHDA